MVTDSSPTSVKPQVSPSEKTSTTASKSSEEEEDEDAEDEASYEHGEFVSQHLPEQVSGIFTESDCVKS